jgi:hypothetical protein
MHPKFYHETNIMKADFAFGKPFDFVNSGKGSQSLIRTIDNRGEALNSLGALPIFIRPWMKYYSFDKFWGDGLRQNQAWNGLVARLSNRGMLTLKNKMIR